MANFITPANGASQGNYFQANIPKMADVYRKREAICALHLPVTGQGRIPLSQIVIPILSVLVHTLFVT